MYDRTKYRQSTTNGAQEQDVPSKYLKRQSKSFTREAAKRAFRKSKGGAGISDKH